MALSDVVLLQWATVDASLAGHHPSSSGEPRVCGLMRSGLRPMARCPVRRCRRHRSHRDDTERWPVPAWRSAPVPVSLAVVHRAPEDRRCRGQIAIARSRTARCGDDGHHRARPKRLRRVGVPPGLDLVPAVIGVVVASWASARAGSPLAGVLRSSLSASQRFSGDHRCDVCLGHW